MNEQQRHGDADASKTGQRGRPGKRLKRLSATEIVRRSERQRPAIARATALGPRDGTDDQPKLEAPTLDLDPRDGAGEVIAHPSMGATTTADDGAGADDAPPSSTGRNATERTEVRSEAPERGPRQMTIWESAEDAEVIAGWMTASTRRDRLEKEQDAEPNEARDAHWCVVTTNPVLDTETRRAPLRNLTTRDDLHLVQQVRPAVLDLVLEHRFQSEESDRRLVALGIRFGVWTLTKTVDGEFDPFRDLTEDRITGFVRATGQHLSPGSRDSYAAALRRLAAGPVIRHRSERRKAPAPLPRAVENGLWEAADGYRPTSWQHQEAKTLLALSFGAGASSEEINLVAPEDVIATRESGSLRVSVRLLRKKTWVRDVPVLEPRYAEWLADRAAQVAGHAYLFKPERASRRNAVNSATRRLAETNHAFERFEPNAARNTWAVTWLQAGVPFPAWANAAGIGPGTHLPADLLAHLPTPDPAEVEAAFRRAALRRARGR